MSSFTWSACWTKVSDDFSFFSFPALLLFVLSLSYFFVHFWRTFLVFPASRYARSREIVNPELAGKVEGKVSGKSRNKCSRAKVCARAPEFDQPAGHKTRDAPFCALACLRTRWIFHRDVTEIACIFLLSSIKSRNHVRRSPIWTDPIRRAAFSNSLSFRNVDWTDWLINAINEFQRLWTRRIYRVSWKV